MAAGNKVLLKLLQNIYIYLLNNYNLYYQKKEKL